MHATKIIKRIFFSFILVIAGGIFVWFLLTQRNSSSPPHPIAHKKIVIITSYGGGGHLSATHAIQQYLKKSRYTYSFIVIDMLKDCLKGLDPVQLITFSKYTGNDFYNYLMRNKWYSMINFSYYVSRFVFSLGKRAHVRAFLDLIARHKPDLIISVVPFINGSLYQAAQETDTPFLVVPTDLDLGVHFTIGLSNPSWEKFKFILPFDVPLIRDTLKPLHINESHVPVSGFPVHEKFFDSTLVHDRTTICRDFFIPLHKPVVMVLMGAAGVIELERVAKELSRLDVPAHIVFCIGRSEFLRPKIRAITFPSSITHTIVGFTDRIAELMSVSDILVTKSGTLSVCEAMYLNIPMLLDGTSPVLLWEQLNHTFVTQNGFGFVIKKRKQWAPVISDLLKNPHKREECRKNLMSFIKPNPQREIVAVIEDLLAPSE